MNYVYILRLANGQFYTGVTIDLKRRLREHLSGHGGISRNYLPAEIIWYCAFSSLHKAKLFEAYLKTGSGQSFRNRHII